MRRHVSTRNNTQLLSIEEMIEILTLKQTHTPTASALVVVEWNRGQPARCLRVRWRKKACGVSATGVFEVPKSHFPGVDASPTATSCTLGL